MNTKELFLARLADFKSNITPDQLSQSSASFLLFKDYLRKLYIWYKELNITSKWEDSIYTKAGHSLTHLIAPNLILDIIDLEDFRINYLDDIVIDKSKYRGFEYIFIYYSIYWDIFKGHPEFKKFSNLPNPYDSVIKILLRGSHIYRGEMGTIEVDNLPIKNDNTFILPSLDDNFLDFLDLKCKRRDSLGIPSQLETNNLWVEFQNSKEKI